LLPELPAGEVDEDRLEARFGDGEVGDAEARSLGRGGDPGDEAGFAPDVELEAVLGAPCAGDAGDLARERAFERFRSPVVFTVTIVSAPTVCLSFAGVSRARTLPWSMIATRPQSRSASSM
jgi:hypothetical protein